MSVVRRGTIGRCALLVAAAAALGGCGEHGRAEPVANPRDEVRVMLRERAERLNGRDLEGWLAPVAPEARAFEEQVGQGALSVPLARVDLTLGAADVDMAGKRFRRARVELVYRYEDLPDDNPFRFWLDYDIERREGSWIVTSSRPASDPMTPQPPFWASGPVEVARSPHFLALHRPGLDGVTELLALAEKAREQLLARVTLEVDARHLVNLAGGPEEYAQFTGADDSIGVATVFYRSAGRAPSRPENRTMSVDTSAILDRGAVPVRHEGGADVFPVEVFQHELGHLALSRFTRPSTPTWVAEGGAMRLADERRVDDWEVIVGRDLFEQAELSFETMSRQDAEHVALTPPQYAYANAGVFYLVEAFGIEKFWDFYQNFKEFADDMSPEVRARGAERLVRRYYGFGLEELDGRTQDWMRQAVAAAG